MDTKTQPEVDRVYEDFEPYHQWDEYDGRFTVMLPGYRRDQMKVQVTSKPALRLLGERPTFRNRWQRFKLEFPLPLDYDTDSVTATFEGGKLSVKFAKLTNPKETTTTNPPEEAPRPKEPSQKADEQKGTPKAKEDKAETKETTTNPPDEAPRPKESPQKADEQKGTPKAKEEKAETKETTTNPPEEARRPKGSPQKADEQKGAQEGVPKAKEEKPETKTNDVSDQKTPPPQKEDDSITEKRRTEASIDKVAEKVRTNGSAETTDAATSNSSKTKDAKFIARCKTRLVDFTLSKALCNQDENEALGNSTTGLKKWKKLVAWVMLILLVVALGLYCRNTFGSSQGELDFEELLLFPY